MRSKIFTTVFVAVIVAPFAYLAYSDAVSIKHNLHEQTTQIQSLNTESVKLDQKLDETQAQKEQTQAEKTKLEQENAKKLEELQRAKAELGNV